MYAIWGSWAGEADEPIAHRREYAEACAVAEDSLAGWYPSIYSRDERMSGEPTIAAYIVDTDTGLTVGRVSPTVHA